MSYLCQSPGYLNNLELTIYVSSSDGFGGFGTESSQDPMLNSTATTTEHSVGVSPGSPTRVLYIGTNSSSDEVIATSDYQYSDDTTNTLYQVEASGDVYGGGPSCAGKVVVIPTS